MWFWRAFTVIFRVGALCVLAGVFWSLHMMRPAMTYQPPEEVTVIHGARGQLVTLNFEFTRLRDECSAVSKTIRLYVETEAGALPVVRRSPIANRYGRTEGIASIRFEIPSEHAPGDAVVFLEGLRVCEDFLGFKYRHADETPHYRVLIE